MINLSEDFKLCNLKDALNHFISRIKLYIESDEIDTTQPAVLNFIVIKNDENYKGYLTLDIPNNIIFDYTNLKAPFFKAKIYNTNTDIKAWNIYHKLVTNRSSEFFKTLTSILRRSGLRELYLVADNYDSKNVQIYPLITSVDYDQKVSKENNIKENKAIAEK